MKIVEQYHAYWQTYIHPLVDKEPKRYAHFTKTLNQVGNRFYGPEFYLELSVAVLYSVFDDPAWAMSDEGQQQGPPKDGQAFK